MSYQPPQYPSGQYPPGQFPPGQYSPGPPPQGQPTQRRRGCRGCLIGCLVTVLGLVVLMVVVVAGGVYAVRQMYPTAGSAREAAGCVVMRVFANNLENALAESDLSEDEKAKLRRDFEQLRRQFEEQCGPLR